MKYQDILNAAETDSERLGLVAASLLTWAQLDQPIPPEHAKEIADAILNRDRSEP